MLSYDDIILKGHTINRGIAIGKIFFLNRDEFQVFEIDIPSKYVEREINRFRNAISRSKQDIKRLQKQLEVESAPEGILILEAQLEMLQDSLLTKEIENEIRKTKKNAEFIFQRTVEEFQKRFEEVGNSFFLERFQDLKDLSRRILSYLYETGNLTLNHVPHGSIICAQELTSSDVAEASSANVQGFITETGGSTSHAAIMTKGKGIPYITKINLQDLKKSVDQLVILDGRTGKVIVDPNEKTLKNYESLKFKILSQTRQLEQMTQWPAETYDGYSVKLLANLDMTTEIDLIHQFGGEGIGLFRSEYIFLPKNEIPSEEDQYRIYTEVIKKMGELPVVIRTFDLGGDKISSLYPFVNDRTPSFGIRTARYLLKEKGMFKAQIKAILRASAYGNVSILFPMISTLSELRDAKKIVYAAQEELEIKSKIRIGCMVEVPSAALNADHFVKECDFLSIGTNDLTQYSLAIDRCDLAEHESHEPSDPSIIRLIKYITEEADQEGVPVSVCGEIASDPRFTSLLLGLGVQELSVTPRSLPVIKNAIRNTSIVEAVQLAEKILTLSTSEEVLEVLQEEYQKISPQDLYYIS